MNLLITLMAGVSIFAGDFITLEMGTVRDVVSRTHFLEDMGPYEIKRSQVVITAKAEGKKSLGRWKRCYTRSLNIPRTPFSGKYTYSPITQTKLGEVDHADNFVTLWSLHADLYDTLNELKEKAPKCDATVSAVLLVELEMERTGELRKYEIFLKDINGGGLEASVSNFFLDENGILQVRDLAFDVTDTEEEQIPLATQTSKRRFR